MANILQRTLSRAFSWVSSVLIKISLAFVPRGQKDDKTALTEIMALRIVGDKPFFATMMIQIIAAYNMKYAIPEVSSMHV